MALKKVFPCQKINYDFLDVQLVAYDYTLPPSIG
jgi:hypothetical protein